MSAYRFIRPLATLVTLAFVSACSLMPGTETSAPVSKATEVQPVKPQLNPASATAASCPLTAAPLPAATCPPCPRCGDTPPPAAKPLQATTWDDIAGWREDDLTAAWPPFLANCKALAGKTALPNHAGWMRACEAARQLKPDGSEAVRAFFERYFTPHRAVAPDGKLEGMMTGYYEPLLKGNRKRSKSAAYPVLGTPDDLIVVDLAEVVPETRHLRLRGRLEGNRLIPYWTRAEIEADLDNKESRKKAKPLLWVEDPIELFFLQIQGSGRVQLPDGTLVRVGYADQNGHPYRSIGRALIDKGELKAHEASMQGIQAWARANPAKLQALLNVNPSYVFFREMPASGEGPLGALGLPLTAERSLAIDPRFIPLGAPVFIATTQPNSTQPLQRLMMAQDTGGAIRGLPRADFFWGFGPKAGEQAGRMKQSGRLWVLLPNDTTPQKETGTANNPG